MKHELVQDGHYPGMWRVRYPDGKLSDMYNFTRASQLLISLERK